jgi:hypothetical protein
MEPAVMAKPWVRVRAVLGWVAVVLAAAGPASGQAPGVAAVEVAASNAATVQKAGPRGGTAGASYFNVEGKNNGEDARYASFGVLDFRPPKPAAPAGKIKGLKLVLVQSLARFSKDGAVKVYLAPESQTALAGDDSPLKFDPTKPGGVGDQIKGLLPLGEAAFKKGTTGQLDTLTLTLTGAAETAVRSQFNAGGTIRLVVVPADDDVAATYFGPKPKDDSQRPRLVIEVGAEG